MRTGTLAAGVAAIVMTHGVPQAAMAMAPIGSSESADAGGILGVTARPGTRLSANFRLRMEAAPTLPPVQRLINPMPRPKRLGSMIDFYPDRDSGLHLSAGMRMLSYKGRPAWSLSKLNRAASTATANMLYAPVSTVSLPDRSNMAKRAPAMTAGWTTMLSERTLFGIEAGTLFEHGRGTKMLAAPAAQVASASWSRIDPVAQVAFAMRF